MNTDTLARLAFVLSLLSLAFAYGYGSRAFGWFPDAAVERAYHQARARLPFDVRRPDYLGARVYDDTGVTTRKREGRQPGLTAISSNWKELDWEPAVRLLSAKGRILHSWRLRPEVAFAGVEKFRDVELKYQTIHDFHVYPDGDLVVNTDYVGLVRLDACGEVIWRLPERTHHSLARDSEGTFWVPARKGHDPDIQGFDGSMIHDHILRVSDDGQILRDIGVLEAIVSSGLGRYVAKFRERGYDTHVNDVEPLSSSLAEEYPQFQAGDLVVSAKNQNLVFVLDPDTGSVKWHTTGPFIRQHDPDFIGDGWIGIFDNNEDGTGRGSFLGGSRIVAVHTTSDSTRVLYPKSDSSTFYTAIAGKWERLDNGNLLLVEAIPGRVLEVKPDGTTVWEWVQEPYGASHVPHVLQARRYSLSPSDIAAWNCDGVAGGS